MWKNLWGYKKYINNGDRKLEYEYAARCSCKNGLEYVYDGRKVNDERNRSNFYIATAQELGMWGVTNEQKY